MKRLALACLCLACVVGCSQRSATKAAKPATAAKQRPASPIARQPASKPAPAPKPERAEEPRPEQPAAEPKGDLWRVVSVHDGDTVLCLDGDNRQHKVRLVGIDAPEIGQAFGTMSRDGLRALVLRKTVRVRDQGEDRYGRTLGLLEIDGADVAVRMVIDGLAWHFTRYSDDKTLAAAEREARQAGRGLWADPDPMPPWEWRETERDRKAAERKPPRKESSSGGVPGR